jgi:ribose 5-phosphate isomerase B
MVAVGIMNSQCTIRAMHVALGADHAGFELKDALKRVLDELGVTYHDFGTTSSESVDYPDVAAAVARAVAAQQFDRGILVCGSGIGMSIAANKVPGIRAAVVSDASAVKLARQHNDANVVAIGSRLTPHDDAVEIVRTFLTTDFEAGRHAQRLDKIRKLESSR